MIVFNTQKGCKNVVLTTTATVAPTYYNALLCVTWFKGFIVLGTTMIQASSIAVCIVMAIKLM